MLYPMLEKVSRASPLVPVVEMETSAKSYRTVGNLGEMMI